MSLINPNPDQPSTQSSESPQDIINEMLDSGFTQEDIQALKDAGQNGEEIPNKNYFVAIDRKTLNGLQYFSKIDENSQQLFHSHAPMSLLRAVGDSQNWENGQYIGFGAKFVEEFLNKELDDLVSQIRLDAKSFATLIVLAKLLQLGIEEQIKHIEEINEKLSNINEMISRATTLKAEAGEDGWTRMPDDMVAFFEKNELEIPGADKELHAEEWDAAIHSMKTLADSISSQSQIETTKLQQRINKFSQAFELLSSLLDKFDKVSKKLVSN